VSEMVWKQADLDQKQRFKMHFSRGLKYEPRLGVLNLDNNCIFNAGELVRRFDLGDSHPQREARTGQEPLWHRPHLAGFPRPADHPFPAPLHEPAAALFSAASECWESSAAVR
jgi:hypothetical protein